MNVTKQEKLDAVIEAQQKLFEVIELLDGISDEMEWWVYLIPLKVLASRGCEWLTQEKNFDDWIADLQSESQEDDMITDWTAVFGNMVTARDMVDSAIAHGLSMVDELRMQYRQLARENPGAGYDEETADFRAMAERIIYEATGAEWYEQDEVDLGL